METIKNILPGILLLLVCGCSSPSLVGLMEARGVSYDNTSRIVLNGSEGDVGSDIQVEIEEPFIIQEIWDSIYQSRSYSVWYTSGYRRADFYIGQDSTPAATLWINASDASHLDGMETRFRCPHLDSLVLKLLEKEHLDKQANKAKQEK